MQLPESLLALLLFSIPPALSEPKPQWPHNLPKHMKYFPEDELHVKRGLSVQERLQRGEKPIGVKKMGTDAGEMFLLDNWIFASDLDHSDQTKRSESTNLTIDAFSPLRPHAERNIFDPLLRFALRASLFTRDFRCPEGTNDCSSIGAPDSCCGTGSTCISIEDTGYGSVGCCPSGQTCQGSISCDESRGYSSCPGSPNGGCCLPGYSCSGVGCVVAGTSVTYVQPSTSDVPPSSTAVVVVPTTPSQTPTPTPTPTTSSTCSTGWFSCPASLGGGCCQDGRACATGTSCIDTESLASTQAPSAPVRPTSNSVVPSDVPSTTEPGQSLCPTGFYVCSAYYPSGCCRVGRDCQTTGTCIETASTVVVNSNGVTIVAPTGAGFATTAPGQGGSCPGGWYSCAASLGGNCCPNGFACENQCTATAGGSVAPKVAPSTASSFSHFSIFVLISLAFASGIAMIIL